MGIYGLTYSLYHPRGGGKFDSDKKTNVRKSLKPALIMGKYHKTYAKIYMIMP